MIYCHIHYVRLGTKCNVSKRVLYLSYTLKLFMRKDVTMTAGRTCLLLMFLKNCSYCPCHGYAINIKVTGTTVRPGFVRPRALGGSNIDLF